MRAFKVFLFALAFAVSASKLEAQDKYQFRLGTQLVNTRDDANGRVRLLQTTADGWTYVVKDKFGLWWYIYGQNSYGSGIFGGYLDFSKSFEVGLAVGAEHNWVQGSQGSTYLRFAGEVEIFGSSICPIDLYGESGPSHDYWYQGTLICRPARGLGLGLVSQRNIGTGPMLAIRLSQGLPFEAWVARVYDYELQPGSRWNWTVGLRLVIEK